MQNNQVDNLTKWLIAFSVILVTVIEVLDMTIVNVALPHMMGALGANTDQITWVLTSYIVASAIVMPLTGFLVGFFGRKQILLICISGFLVSSLLCGISTSLTEMVIFRITQGMFGSLLIPLSQYILIETFPENERGKAMALWGIGVMVAPILGPTLGGIITESWNWRWIFFINIPVCALAFLMIFQLLKQSEQIKRKIDWISLTWMFLGVGCLQTFLDRGQTEDWFESKLIISLMMISFISLTIFIYRSLKYPNPLINLRVFKDINFAQSCFMVLCFGGAFFSIIVLQPIMMQNLMGYSPYYAGLVMAPRGLTSAITMIFIPKLLSKIDARWLMAIGLLILSYSSFLMSGFTLTSSFKYMSIVSAIQGVGVGAFFVPLSTIAFSNLPTDQQAEGSGLYNFTRNIGMSIGISAASTFYVRSSQMNWNNLISNLSLTNVNLQNWLNQQFASIHDPYIIAYLTTQLSKQANMIGFINTYWLIGAALLMIAPLTFLLKRPARGAKISHLE